MGSTTSAEPGDAFSIDELSGIDGRFAPELRTWIKVPLGDNSDPIGHIGLSSLSESNFSEEDLRLLERVASQISPAIDKARLYQQIQKEVLERTVLADIGRAVSSSTEMKDFFDEFAELVKKLIPFDSMAYSDVDPQAGIVALRYWHDIDLPPVGVLKGVTLEGTITAEAIAANGPIVRPFIYGKAISEHATGVDLNPDKDLRSTLCMPLWTRGEVFGCLYLGSNTEDSFTEDHVKLMSLVGTQVSGALSNARHHEARIEAETE